MQARKNSSRRLSGAISIAFLVLGLFVLPLVAEVSDCSMGCCTGSASAALAAPMEGCCETACDMQAAPEAEPEKDLALTAAKNLGLNAALNPAANVHPQPRAARIVPPEPPAEEGNALYLRNSVLLI
jgi:hypothetical protein